MADFGLNASLTLMIFSLVVNGYGRNGKGEEAIELYRRMPPNLRNAVSDVCVLNACSHAGLIDQAEHIYQSITNKTEQIVTVMVRTAFHSKERMIFHVLRSNLGRLLQSYVHV